MLSRPSKLGGPVPKFNDYHIWKAFECLDENTPVGRKKLSQMLGIGEGSTRTILAMMQDQNMIIIGIVAFPAPLSMPAMQWERARQQ